MCSPVISPDGKFLAYTYTSASERNLVHGTSDGIMLFDLDTMEEIVFVTGNNSQFTIAGWSKKNVAQRIEEFSENAMIN